MWKAASLPSPALALNLRVRQPLTGQAVRQLRAESWRLAHLMVNVLGSGVNSAGVDEWH